MVAAIVAVMESTWSRRMLFWSIHILPPTQENLRKNGPGIRYKRTSRAAPSVPIHPCLHRGPRRLLPSACEGSVGMWSSWPWEETLESPRRRFGFNILIIQIYQCPTFHFSCAVRTDYSLYLFLLSYTFFFGM